MGMKISNKVKLFIFLSIIILCLLGCENNKEKNKEHPKDTQLIQNFQEHKAAFNQLVQMFQADKSLGRVAFDFTRTANFFEKCEGSNAWNGKEIEVSNERLDEYRKSFKILGLSAGIEGYCEKKEIVLIASTEGTAISGGSSKGYAFLKAPPENLEVDSLDKYKLPYGKSFTAYKHIEGNWYLYFDNED